MIQYEADHTTLFFVDGSGQKFSADPIGDWQRYTAFEQTRSDQQKVAGININRESNYVTAVARWNASVDSGRPPSEPQPVKPMRQVVGDPVFNSSNGAWSPGVPTDVPFDHALPDPHPLPKDAIVSGLRGPVGSTVTPASNTDLLGVLITGQRAANEMLAKIAAKLSV